MVVEMSGGGAGGTGAAGLPVLLVHGGAGALADDEVAARLTGCRAAALQGWEILQGGGSALDAVQRAVEVLEDDPLFNAGTGSVLNAAGRVQLDASIMAGQGNAAGAVAAVTGFRHPIQIARRLLDDRRHVLLVGEGARHYAVQAGIAECPEEALIVERQRRRWTERHGTVGCVAVDLHGRTAAATSTGGVPDALPGRVGDSALIGCGTYATDLGAVSCTGLGEAIIRVGLARTALELIAAGQEPAAAAAEAVAHLVAVTGAEAGLIVVDRHGRVGHARNSRHMPVCEIRADGVAVVRP
jgi:beta-aspartyl-peptidase (threonine type)